MKILIIILTICFLFGCKKNTEYDKFIQEISKFESFNTEYTNLYYNEFLKTNSYILSLNKVNYPNFYKTKSNKINYQNILLINKQHGIDRNYRPNNLVEVSNVDYIKRSNETMYIDKKALEAYSLMVQDAKTKNINLVLFSAYRTFEKQESLWNDTPSFDNMYLAVPGYSEHHTGLALDISTIDDGLSKNKTEAYKYLEQNAYKFGFILRYPKNKTDITGYSFEPWHFRYVGDIASIIYENNLTLEEYIYNYIAI